MKEGVVQFVIVLLLSYISALLARLVPGGRVVLAAGKRNGKKRKE